MVAEPEIKSFTITKDHDFIVMGCDGIFDKLSNSETISCVWNSAKDNKTQSNGLAQDVHELCGSGVEYVLNNSLLRKSLDNVTVVMIAFSNYKHATFGESRKSSSNVVKASSMPTNREGSAKNTARE